MPIHSAMTEVSMPTLKLQPHGRPRILIAAQFHPGVLRQPTPEEIRAVHLAWAQAAA